VRGPFPFFLLLFCGEKNHSPTRSKEFFFTSHSLSPPSPPLGITSASPFRGYFPLEGGSWLQTKSSPPPLCFHVRGSGFYPLQALSLSRRSPGLSRGKNLFFPLPFRPEGGVLSLRFFHFFRQAKRRHPFFFSGQPVLDFPFFSPPPLTGTRFLTRWVFFPLHILSSFLNHGRHLAWGERPPPPSFFFEATRMTPPPYLFLLFFCPVAHSGGPLIGLGLFR